MACVKSRLCSRIQFFPRSNGKISTPKNIYSWSLSLTEIREVVCDWLTLGLNFPAQVRTNLRHLLSYMWYVISAACFRSNIRRLSSGGRRLLRIFTSFKLPTCAQVPPKQPPINVSFSEILHLQAKALSR